MSRQNIFQQVIARGDSFVYKTDTTEKEYTDMWIRPNHDIFVAEKDGHILGAYIIKPNQLGRGSHIANCSYMVSESARGMGLGDALCRHSIDMAKQKNYLGMQFNIVVSTNTAAVKLWKKHGFDIIGTTPNGFNHKEFGYVDTYIMYKSLQE